MLLKCAAAHEKCYSTETIVLSYISMCFSETLSTAIWICLAVTTRLKLPNWDHLQELDTPCYLQRLILSMSFCFLQAEYKTSKSTTYLKIALNKLIQLIIKPSQLVFKKSLREVPVPFSQEASGTGFYIIKLFWL